MDVLHQVRNEDKLCRSWNILHIRGTKTEKSYLSFSLFSQLTHWWSFLDTLDIPSRSSYN